MNLAKEKQKAQLSGLLTGNGLQGMIERRNYHAVDTVSPFVASFSDKSPGFVERCDLKWMNASCTELVNSLLFDYNGAAKTS